MSKRHISATVNGDPVEFLADPGMTLLDALRDELGLTGSKEGCGSWATAGPAVSSSTAGWSARAWCWRPKPRAAAWKPSKAWPRAASCIRCNASSSSTRPLQCGFCTPGLLVAAKALLEANPDPSETEDPLTGWRVIFAVAPGMTR